MAGNHRRTKGARMEFCKEGHSNWVERHGRRWCSDCRSLWNIASRRRLRVEALAHYGPSCQCCGETRFEFLAFDHINGGGSAHLKSLNGTHIDQWLKNNNWPEGFQVLCHNCNMAKGWYGMCPHELEKEGP